MAILGLGSEKKSKKTKSKKGNSRSSDAADVLAKMDAKGADDCPFC